MIHKLLDEYYVDEKILSEMFSKVREKKAFFSPDGYSWPPKTQLQEHLSAIWFLETHEELVSSEMRELSTESFVTFIKENAAEIGEAINKANSPEREILSLIRDAWSKTSAR